VKGHLEYYGLELNGLKAIQTVVVVQYEEWPTPRLRGFLFLSRDRLRLYLDDTKLPGVTGVDVRATGAVTAVLTALSGLVDEEERITGETDDPHCDRRIDLTSW